MSFVRASLPVHSWSASGLDLNAGEATAGCQLGSAGWREYCKVSGPLSGISSADLSSLQCHSVTVSHYHSRQHYVALSELDWEPRTPTLRHRLTSPGAATSGSATPRLRRASQVGVPPYYWYYWSLECSTFQLEKLIYSWWRKNLIDMAISTKYWYMSTVVQ